jgi:hypothetical protein
MRLGIFQNPEKNVNGKRFVDQVSQSWKRIPGGFEVFLNDGGAKGVVRQVWHHGYPWAVLHVGQAVEARLVEPRPAEDVK